ncbi:hypothetical protein G5S37_29140 [Roseimicrobium sp. ORNL1]|nr:hypothetical protein G5S37_29140 [Roseimicrobium sp. ORNL1]
MSFLLLMGVAGITGRAVSQEPNGSPSAHTIASFLAADLPDFQIQNLDLEAAVEALRTAVTKHTSSTAPAIGVIRYDGNPPTEANPWQMRESISLALGKCSAADVLHYLAEGTGFVTYADRWRVVLYEVPVSTASRAGTLSPNLKGTMSVREFAKLKLPKFRCENASAQEAVRILRETSAKVSGKQSPPVVVIRFRRPEAPPVVEADRATPVSFDLKDLPAVDVLRYIGELSGCTIEFRDTCMVIREVATLYHPKHLRQFQLTELEAVWGKAGRPVEDWLVQKLTDIPVLDIGYNERTGQVFIVCPPEYMGAILRGPDKGGSNKSKKPLGKGS